MWPQCCLIVPDRAHTALKADFEDEGFKESLTATAEDLLSMNVVPVFNENDAVMSKRSPSPVRPVSVAERPLLSAT